MKLQDKDFNLDAIGKCAVDDMKEIVLLRITEQEKTRRLLIVLTAILVVFAACLMVFAPENRQGTSVIIGIVLIVLAMGSIGASQFVIKGPGWSVGTAKQSAESVTEQNDKPPSCSVSEGEETADRTKPGYTHAA